MRKFKKSNIKGQMQATKQTFYKNGKKVILRKPRESVTFIPFTATFVKSRFVGTNTIKTFLKYVITDIKELNFIKNDVCFLMHDLFNNNGNNDFATSMQYPIEQGTIIYIWTYFPFQYDLTKFDTPAEIREGIFAFDLFFTRLNLSDKNCKRIKDILFKDVDVKVYCRKLNEVPRLPCSIRSIN